jgi:hypothetical protein
VPGFQGKGSREPFFKAIADDRQSHLKIERAITADDFAGEPWPPSFPGRWFLIDSRCGFSWWRRITLSIGADDGR